MVRKVSMLFAKTDLKSRLLSGSYKHADLDNVSTVSSEASHDNKEG